MAEINLSVFVTGFNTDNFWAGRATPPTQETGTTYDFLNSPVGYFVRVTGTGLTYSSHDPAGGTYTDIGVYTDVTYTTLVDSYHSDTPVAFAAFFSAFATNALVGADTITGSTGDDRITGYGGADDIDGVDGSDTYVFNTGDVILGEQITDTGASGTDTILINAGGLVQFIPGTAIGGIEAVTFAGSGAAEFFTAAQLPSNLVVTGVAAAAQVLNVYATSSFSASGWTFTSWGDVFDAFQIFGGGGADTITGSSQADVIQGSGGADTLDGVDGGDVYQFSANDVAAGEVIHDTGISGIDILQVSGNIDFTPAATIAGIERVQFSNPGIGTFNANQLLPANLDIQAQSATVQTLAIKNAHSFSAAGWTFTNWDSSHTLTISGTTGNDAITGSSQIDTITGGKGRDFMAGGAMHDVFDFNLKSETGKTAGTRDRIIDFTHNVDDIDLQTIDASTKSAGNQKFKWISTNAFHHKAGELHYFKQNQPGTSHDKTIVEGDVNGDGHADFQIELTGLKTLTAGDFIL